MPYRVYTTKEFDDNFNHLEESDKIRVKKILNQLKEEGGDVGKPLRYPYFKEKRLMVKGCIF